MKLSYWVAEIKTDSSVYNVRTRTKKECIARVAELDHQTYGPPTKVSVEYAGAFDLMDECLCEGGGYWETSL